MIHILVGITSALLLAIAALIVGCYILLWVYEPVIAAIVTGFFAFASLIAFIDWITTKRKVND